MNAAASGSMKCGLFASYTVEFIVFLCIKFSNLDCYDISD
jgi:hypothetical protein